VLKSESIMQERKFFTKLGIAFLLGGMFAIQLEASPRQQPSPAPTIANQASPSSPAPLTLDEVIRLIKQNKKNPQQVISAMAGRGVDFDLDEKTEKKLRKAGADDDLLPEIWKATPKGKAHIDALLTTATGVEIKASLAEALALQDIQNESDADHRAKMADEFEKKYPSSPLLSYVYTAAAKAYQEKGDLDNAVTAARKSLKIDPDNTFSLIILALVLPQPKELQGSASAVRDHLQEAKTDAKKAITLLEKLKQRPDESDSQFQDRKGALTADAHFALGMVNSQQEQFEEALAEYKLAISSTSKPTFQYYYRLAEAYASVGQVPQAIEVLQTASELARGTPMQKYADDFMAELRQKAH
jgi:tetratricopeptide (TPR) repeat protein